MHALGCLQRRRQSTRTPSCRCRQQEDEGGALYSVTRDRRRGEEVLCPTAAEGKSSIKPTAERAADSVHAPAVREGIEE